jgi:hypothetical protein
MRSSLNADLLACLDCYVCCVLHCNLMLCFWKDGVCKEAKEWVFLTIASLVRN